MIAKCYYNSDLFKHAVRKTRTFLILLEYVAGIRLISSILRILSNLCSHFSISRDTLLAKAEFLTKIGEKDAAVEAVRKTMEKTVGLGNRMDLLFHNIRIGLFWMDHSLIKANLEKATIMMEEGGKNERIMIQGVSH